MTINFSSFVKFDASKVGRDFCLALVPVFLYFLIPFNWEPTSESFIAWSAAKLLRNYEGFVTFSRGPLYYLYLNLFSLIEYPLNLKIEKFISTLLFTYSMFFLFRSYFKSSFLSLFLVLCWSPTFFVAEGGRYIFGGIFVAMYFTKSSPDWCRNGPLPLSLLLASLCHNAYFAFIVGHVLGELYLLSKKRDLSSYLETFLTLFQGKKLFVIVPLLLFIFSYSLFKLEGPMFNHLMHAERYLPVPANSSPMNIGFFQTTATKFRNGEATLKEGLSKEVMNEPSWYNIHKAVFGNTQSVANALINHFQVTLDMVLINLRSGIKLPNYLLTGLHGYHYTKRYVIFYFFSLFIICLGFFYFILNGEQKDKPFYFSAYFGSGAIFFALLWVVFSDRYLVSFTPAIFFLLSNLLKKIEKRKTYLSWLLFIIILGGGLNYFHPTQKRNDLKGFSNKLSKVTLFQINKFSGSSIKKISQMLSKGTKVMVADHAWVHAFTTIGHRDLVQFGGLPPFAGDFKIAKELLNQVEVFILGNDIINSTDVNTGRIMRPRYHYHIEPYLEMHKNEFIVTHLDGYGLLYKRM